MIKHYRKIVLTIIVGLLLILSAFFFYSNFIITGRSISPDKKYQVSYNQFKKIVTCENLKDNIKSYTVYGDHPVFLWSPDSKFLAVTYTASNGKRSQIESLENSIGMSVPSKSQIQDRYNETQTTDKSDDNSTITVTEWLDRSHALVKFSWPSDTQGKTIAGWFTCEFPSRTIKDFHMIQ